jgi:nucleotide-binding universal stress UspA family protein
MTTRAIHRSTSSREAADASVDARAEDRLELFENILCGVDGTRSAYEAVRQAAALAAPGGRLAIVAVAGGDARENGRGAFAQTTIAPERARATLGYAARLAREAGVRPDTELDRRGPVGRVLLERARRHTLLAVGAPAMSRLAHILIGGIASEATHALPSSVLIARRAPAGTRFGERILLASDALALSDRLVGLGIRLARERDAELVLVHAAREESRFRPLLIARQSERVVAALGDRARVRVEAGRATAVIAAVAAAEGASLILVSSRRARGLRALGSVSERVAHDAPCSVLVVRPQDLRP